MKKTSFSFLFSAVKNKQAKHLVVANGVDIHTLAAVSEAVKKGIVTVSITGDRTQIKESCRELSFDEQYYAVIHCDNEDDAVAKAVAMAKSGEAQLIMKGLISTDKFMKAILNKENGLLPAGTLLTHITLLNIKKYHKPLLLSDVAIIPLPTLNQKIQQTKYLIEFSRKLGNSKPKVAFIAATEKVIEKMPACADAYQLKQLWQTGEFPNSFCDGPMALDVALDEESAHIKGIHSEIAGDADCLLFPNIESGNVFYKTNTKFCKSQVAAIVAGTSVPTVLSSRGDTIETKLNSIALAALLG